MPRRLFILTFFTSLIIVKPNFCFCQYFEFDKFKTTWNFLKVKPNCNSINNSQEKDFVVIDSIGIDSFRVKTFTMYLQNSNERPFLDNNEIKRAYRFLLLRSFRNSIIINLTEDSGKAKVETKWVTKNKTDSIKVSWLPISKVVEFENLLIASNFWDDIETIIKDKIYLDGSEWIIEAKQNNKYHFLYRFSPDEYSTIDKVGKWLITNSMAVGEKLY